jgi:hypothetical protein
LGERGAVVPDEYVIAPNLGNLNGLFLNALVPDVLHITIAGHHLFAD